MRDLKKSKKIYIYPTYNPVRDKTGNLYIKYFRDSFGEQQTFVVINRGWKVGILSAFFNIDADVFIIHWVDLIPYKRLGIIQFLIFLFLLRILHILRKEVIWFLHNKHAHRGDSKLVEYGMRQMAKYSSKVVVHSFEGISFFNVKYPQYKGKCICIPHPIYTSKLYDNKDEKWDYIIWGGISKRKNVLEFLRFVNRTEFFLSKKILICGYCSDKEYDLLIKDEMGNNITYINSFVDDEELIGFIQQSKIILFTYNPDSMLSSGALIYSLNFGKPIIGPNVGNFADMEGIVFCYNKFEEIPLLKPKCDAKRVKDYLNNNTWEKFPSKLIN